MLPVPLVLENGATAQAPGGDVVASDSTYTNVSALISDLRAHRAVKAAHSIIRRSLVIAWIANVFS